MGVASHVWAAACVFVAAAQAADGPPPVLAARELSDLSLEQLSNVVISTVSGRAEPLSGALGSVHVISGEDIRRSGATSLPEALRLAPNLQVAQAGALGYAITARGFNGTLANKLLVLMDGRSIYTPTFSGVFWEAHDLLLDDVERIEVISGPGGVLWGANAVNGVINIITRSAASTRGTLAGAAAGTHESGAFARYGGHIADGSFRVYAKQWRWKNLEDEGGTERRDGSERLQAGFRGDWERGRAAFTVQGDVYASEGNQTPNPQALHGANVLARWRHDLGNGDALRVQAYYDRTSREQQHLYIADVDVQHALARRGAHRVLWGAGLRHSRDRIQNSAALALIPADKDLRSWNVYLVDEIALGRNLDLSVGAKVDHNSYTGAEFLPSVRMGWRLTPQHLLWGAGSRAVRTPSRFDRELFLPGNPPFLLAGGPEFESEVANVYEIGYRGQLSTDASLSATAFFHDLDKVRTVGPGPGAARVENNREGHTRGIETWGALRVTDGWRLQAGYTHLDTRLGVKPGQVDLQPPQNIGSDPRSWWNLRSTHDLGGGWEFDVLARHHGALANRGVPSYTAVDLRVGWRAPALDVSLLLQNLFDPGHVEWAPAAAQLERAALVKVTLRF
ncbi:MAG: TonB-dependent receptor [Burkholderiaceae bacterium]|nr:TonB-dependent receptor [Burkholderiaceae bacterium]